MNDLKYREVVELKAPSFGVQVMMAGSAGGFHRPDEVRKLCMVCANFVYIALDEVRKKHPDYYRNYESATAISSMGGYGVQVRINGDMEVINRLPSDSPARYTISQAVETMFRGISDIQNRDEAKRKAVIQMYLECFPPALSTYEETANLYGGGYGYVNVPWIVVQTDIGPVRIGWRKRVIEIEWNESKVSKTANELFPDEETTKSGRLVHAWGYDKAKEYIAILLAQKVDDEQSAA